MGEQSFTLPGWLIQSVNPTISKTHRSIPFYLLESTVLVALTASIFQSLTVSDLKMVPKLAPTKEYPYRQNSGELSITRGFSKLTSCFDLQEILALFVKATRIWERLDQ